MTLELVVELLLISVGVRYRVRTGAPTARGASRVDDWFSGVAREPVTPVVLEVGILVVGFTLDDMDLVVVVLGTV